jgi:hypothetical protein
MKRLAFTFLFASIFTTIALGQDRLTGVYSTGNTPRIIDFEWGEPYQTPPEQSAVIKGIRNFGNGVGLAWTATSVYRTADNGQSWIEITPPKQADQLLSQVYFSNPAEGMALLIDTAKLQITQAQTNDGGSSWSYQPLEIDPDQLQDADLGGALLLVTSGGPRCMLHIPLQTSSNFRGSVMFTSNDCLSWKLYSRGVELNRDLPAKTAVSSGNWALKTDGNCLGYKSGCIQESTISIDGQDITPPQIRVLADKERQLARNDAVPMFALTPGGSTRISTNKGFDKCTAFSTAQAQVWWDASPYYNVNIYMSGRNRACTTQPFNGNPAWLTQVNAMGWGLIPTVVGYQSPCTASQTTVKLSYDLVTAEQQGRGEADIAVNDANAIGITAGSILYYDMERYDPPNPDTLGCEPATRAFLKGWTDRIHELSYISGVYGSPFNAQNHWVNLPTASKMDVVWLANWDNRPTVWFFNSFQSFPTSLWPDHQRVKQYFNGTESWGGVQFNIDRDISDAPVAAPAVAPNKVADFDGDGKSDISVWRPDTGVWYAATSSNGSFIALQFGISSDILAPGDYDGDGKTDEAVFRPSEGSWHILTKAGIYSTRQFGTVGDIPVAADYNGDGKTDIAVFRPADGVWYIANSDSQGTFTFIQFGVSGDKPVPADYDGDGKADVAVYRLNNGAEEWWLNRSAAGVFATSFGAAGDNAIQADYTGDGKADIAVFRPSTGFWYVLRSEDLSYFAFPFGTNGDVASPGDYDGDRHYDAAVFRPSTGIWYVQLSTGGFSIVSFGQQGDHSVPQAYLPQ